MSGSETRGGGASRARLGLALRVVGTVAGLAWVLTHVDGAALVAAVSEAGPVPFALATGLQTGNLLLGSLRWRVLMRAYGATSTPPLGTVYRRYLEGFFYNTYLPGGVGGDLVRGVASRDVFAAGRTTASSAAAGVAVVLVDRALGLCALLLLAGAALVGGRLAGAGTTVAGVEPLWLGVGGGAVAVAGLLTVVLARRVGAFVPRPIGPALAALPALERPAGLGAAFALSVVIQVVVALTGHVFLARLFGAPLVGSLVLVPVSMASAFLPISVGGAGVREAAFAALSPVLVGASAEGAAAVALMLWSTQLLVAAAGGVSALVGRRSEAGPS